MTSVAAVFANRISIAMVPHCQRMIQLLTQRTRGPASVMNGRSSSLSVRTHMNHGGSFMGSPPPLHGPRQALQLGLDVTKASQNVLRLLESSHGIHNYSAHYQDTSSPCWHNSCGLRWSYDGPNGQWVARPPHGDSNPTASLDWIPTVSWVQFSDDRTALAKLQGMDGSFKYISLLRLDNTTTDHYHQSPSSLMQANDGWVIVREVTCPTGTNTSTNQSSSDLMSLIQCLQDYLNIEHGGGIEDYSKAKEELFAPQASLLTVGMAPSDQIPTKWSAPVGTLLEIPLDVYLEGVKTQTPHPASSRSHDAIVQIDMTTTKSNTGSTSAAAAATVKVGNGARTLVFVDHLLLGKQGTSGWKILSKTFSPQLWEDDDSNEEIILDTQSHVHHHSHDHGHCHHHDHGSN